MQKLLDILIKLGDAEFVVNLLNAYILFYNRYYKINEHMFIGVDYKNETSTNHTMDLLTDLIDEYNDNIKILSETQPTVEMGEYYTLLLDTIPRYYAKSCISLLIYIVKENLVYSNWEILFSEI